MADDAKYEKCPFCPARILPASNVYECGTEEGVHGLIRGGQCYENELETVKAQRDKLVRVSKAVLPYLPTDTVLTTKIAHVEAAKAFRETIAEIEAESEVN
jgi:hypothetical protein